MSAGPPSPVVPGASPPATGAATVPTGNSPTGQRGLIGAAGIVATVAFFLPWLSVCGETVSGAALASAPNYSSDGSTAILWVVPMLGGALALMAFRGASRNPLIWVSFSGAGFMVIVYASVASQRIDVVGIEYGFVLDTVSFFGAAALAASIPRPPP